MRFTPSIHFGNLKRGILNKVPVTIPAANAILGTNFESYANGYNGNIVDSYGNTLVNQAGITVTTTDSSPGLTKSVYFNGTNQAYYMLTSPPQFDFGTNPWTFECWFKTLNAANLQGLISKRNGGGAAPNCFAVELIGGKLYFTLDVTASPVQIDLGAITNNQWTHVACVRGPGVAYGFVNGIQMGSLPWTPSFTNPYPIVIGGRAKDYHYLNGYMSSFALFDTAKYPQNVNFTPPQNIFA